ncbi:MAG: murein L,D-transpeptidase [Chloroflexi bacterium]|nr:MAG: murein L,D-transpeptidase [Chloroflexota bacterium]
MSKPLLSRRDFLKLSSYGLMGIFLPDLSSRFPYEDSFANLQGRIIDHTVWAHDEPNSKSKRAKLYWQDLVVSITNTTIGDSESAYNRVWYQLEEGGYAYSGGIQPVRTILNQPGEIPSRGALGEVSVPYTDAYLEADPKTDLVYRLYYETIHWVTKAVNAADGSTWYRLLDDKFEQHYYVPAKHIRLLSNEELAPLSPDVPSENKRVELRLDDQLLLAYENGRMAFATRVSTGGKRMSGKYTTPVGDFITYHKRPTRHMAAGDIASNGFDLPGVPWVLYITEGGISFHGTYWHNDYGHPHSHGCINMTPQAAKWLYRWTLPTVPPEKLLVYGHVGTKVEIKV